MRKGFEWKKVKGERERLILKLGMLALGVVIGKPG